MRKLMFLFSFALAISLLSGCANNPRHSGSVDGLTKKVFLECKEKVDVVKDSLSELTMEESGDYDEPTKSARRNIKYYNELTKERYLTLQNFGLYVLNNVYHCVTYGYDSENVPLTDVIYDEVNNELDANLREYLKSNNLYSKFYMQINKDESNYSFAVDWLGTKNLRGSIYCGGNIEMDGNDVSKFTVSSFTQDESCYVFTAHYDFVSNDFYMLSFSVDRNAGLDLLNTTISYINKLNNAQLEATDFEDTDFSNIYLAKGKITKNINEINYQGYTRNNYEDTPIEKSSFESLFNSLKDKFTANKVRTSADKLNYSSSRRVHYMDAALKYGLDVTKLYVKNYQTAIFPFISASDFANMCNQVPEAYKDFFVLAKRKLSSLSRDVSFLYDDDDINISLELQNERYYSLNTYNVDDFSYSITDKAKDEKIIFSIKGDKIVNVYISNLDVIPDDDPNYEEVIKVAHSFSNSQQEALNLLVSNFNKKYQNKYRVELSRGFNVVDDISIAASAGEKETLPQLALANTLDLEKIVSDDSLRKYLYNLDSVINDENIGLSESERNMFNKTMFDDTNNYSVEGRWSLPYSSSNLYLCYDSTLFEGDNPQFDHLPKTFEDMMEMCSILKQSKGNNYVPLYVNYDSSFIMDLMLQKDIPMFSSNAQTTEFIKDEYRNQIINLMSELKGYYDSGLFTSKGITGQYASGSDHAFVIAVASSVNYLAPSYKLAPIPYVNGHQAYFHSGDLTGLTLLKTGKPYATRGAWLFAKELMSSSSINEPLSRLSVPAIDFTYEPTGNELTDNMMSVYQNVKDKYVCFPKVKGANEICNILNSFLARTIQTGSSVDSAVSRLIEEIRNAIL